MAALAGLAALTVCAVVAAAVWAAQAVSRPPAAREPGLAVTAWALLTAGAGVLGLAGNDVLDLRALALLLVADLAALAAVVTAARGVVRTALAVPLAEGVLLAAGAIGVLWAVVGGSGTATPEVGVTLAAAVVALGGAAFLGRVPVRARTGSLAPGDGRRRPVVLAAAAALGAVGVSDVLLAGSALAGTPSPAVAFGLRAVACLVATAVPWIGPARRPGPRREPGRAVELLPYPVAAVAALALLAGAVAGRTGVVPAALAAVVVGALVAVELVERGDRGRLRAELGALRRRHDALVGTTTDVVLGVDALGRVSSANDAALRLLHRGPEALIALDVAEFAVPERRAAVRQAVDDVLHGRTTAHRVEVALAPPGTGSADLRIQAVPGGAVVNLSDVTEAVRLRERLDRLARFDELTGLPNRADLLARLARQLREGAPAAVLYCDLDGFKGVNDRFGHRAGDGVLVEAARRLEALVPDLPGRTPLVGRAGGDEFVVVLTGVSPPELDAAADRVVAALRPTVQVADRAVRVGVSVGVAASGDVPATADPDGGADGLLHRADVAMVAAKQAGRLRAVRWTPEISERALRRVDIAIGLRRALDADRLALAYQPLVRLSDGAVVGVEALLRVEPQDDGPGALAGLAGLVSPAELVAVAEDTGEITEVGRWVLAEATLQAARWRDLGHEILLAVNVSVRQLATEGVVDDVRRALDAAGLAPAALALEITEGQLLQEGDPAWSAVEQLRAMGVMLVIDDFGSGYSSLAYLRRMPVRAVKLDRALLDDLVTDPRARTLARAVIAAARALGLLVVAEGLETLQAARIARDLGAWAGQGFALHQAMPADAVTAVLARPARGLGGGPGPGGGPGAGPGPGGGNGRAPVDGYVSGRPADLT